MGLGLDFIHFVDYHQVIQSINIFYILIIKASATYIYFQFFQSHCYWHSEYLDAEGAPDFPVYSGDSDANT